MAENVDTSSELTDVAKLLQSEVPENEVPGTAVPENDVNSGSCTSVTQNEPEWYCDCDAWVKIFLEPVAPGKFRQFDYIYNVPGESEFPKDRWSSRECIDGFHITRRKDVWAHLPLHDYKSAYIAEVVSMGEEFYDNPDQLKRKVRVVAFGPAVPLADVLGKHPDDFKHRHMLVWSVLNNHLELVKLVASKNSDMFSYSWAFNFALVNEKEQIADFLIEINVAERQKMLNYAIHRGRADFVKRLMETTSVDVSFFRMACGNGQFEIFQLLCDKYGDPRCSDIILEALRGGNTDILKYINSRGVDMSDFEIFVSVCTDYGSNVETLKYLVSEGADVKHPLIAYLAKTRARADTRRYLLNHHIEDKSNVPVCEKLEKEIHEIRTNLIKRIEAGEFDGK
jgi:hypothetical protein